MASQASNLNNNWFNSGRSSSNLFSSAPQPSVYTQQMPEGLKINENQANSLTPSQNSPTIDTSGTYYTPNMFDPNSPGAQSPGTTNVKPSSTAAPANTQATNLYGALSNNFSGVRNEKLNTLTPNLWNTNVTAGTVNPDLSPGATVNFSSSASPNINYPTADAAKQMGQMFGANVYQQNLGGNYGPAGAPSAPMYGLDFGIGDPQNAGQVAFWLQRGDKPEDIMARLQAGIFTPYGVGIRDNMGQNWDTANPLFTTTTPGVGTLTAGKTATVNPGQPMGGALGLTQNNPFYNGTVTPPGTIAGTAPTGGSNYATNPGGTTQPPTSGASAIDWSRWQQLLNSLYYPAAEGANTSAFSQNITPAMQQGVTTTHNPLLGNDWVDNNGNTIYLPQNPLTPAEQASGAENLGRAFSLFSNLLSIFGGNASPQPTNPTNPILSSFLSNLLYRPTR